MNLMKMTSDDKKKHKNFLQFPEEIETKLFCEKAK